ncbi:MAG: 2-polyprenyl-6-methoxyphenol hydroxylase, partial [Xanthobacteraceae bacterium]
PGWPVSHTRLIPAHDIMNYVPTTWPGARLPHIWLDDGSAMQDRIGHALSYTLLRLGRTKADTAGLQKAFASLGAPLRILDIPDETPREVYGHDLLLLRPDMHVIWRGNAPPEEPETLAKMATGN